MRLASHAPAAARRTRPTPIPRPPATPARRRPRPRAATRPVRHRADSRRCCRRPRRPRRGRAPHRGAVGPRAAAAPRSAARCEQEERDVGRLGASGPPCAPDRSPAARAARPRARGRRRRAVPRRGARRRRSRHRGRRCRRTARARRGCRPRTPCRAIDPVALAQVVAATGLPELAERRRGHARLRHRALHAVASDRCCSRIKPLGSTPPAATQRCTVSSASRGL